MVDQEQLINETLQELLSAPLFLPDNRTKSLPDEKQGKHLNSDDGKVTNNTAKESLNATTDGSNTDVGNLTTTARIEVFKQTGSGESSETKPADTIDTASNETRMFNDGFSNKMSSSEGKTNGSPRTVEKSNHTATDSSDKNNVPLFTTMLPSKMQNNNQTYSTMESSSPLRNNTKTSTVEGGKVKSTTFSGNILSEGDNLPPPMVRARTFSDFGSAAASSGSSKDDNSVESSLPDDTTDGHLTSHEHGKQTICF